MANVRAHVCVCVCVCVAIELDQKRVEICGQNRKTGHEAAIRTTHSQYLCFGAAVRRNGL